MARFVQEYRLQGSPDACFQAVHQFLTREGFEYTVYEQEQVFQKGNGWVLAPTFLKVTFAPDRVRLEAWIKMALMPGVFAGEYPIEGFYGCAAKGTMKNAVKTLDRVLGGPAARIGCDSFLMGVNADMGMQTLPPQYAPQSQYAPQYVPQQAVPQFAVCRYCGAKAAAGTRFCPNCGAQMN